MPKLLRDPRTVARDIPGIFDAVFPQLTSRVVRHLNSQRTVADVVALQPYIVAQSTLQPAMLFEIGVAVGESLIEAREIRWDECAAVAHSRQRRYYDADPYPGLTSVDREIAERVGFNIAAMIAESSAGENCGVVVGPDIPGMSWVASGRGDFACGRKLIEVKCTSKNFSAADYRQVLMYWLLSYASSIEVSSSEWTTGVLLNPRLGHYLSFKFDDLIQLVSGGRSKVELLQIFAFMVADISD